MRLVIKNISPDEFDLPPFSLFYAWLLPKAAQWVAADRKAPKIMITLLRHGRAANQAECNSEAHHGRTFLSSVLSLGIPL